MSYLFGAKFIQIPRGTTAQITVEAAWETEDGTSPLDLTEASVVFTILKYVSDKVPAYSRKGSHGEGFTITANAGKLQLTLSAAETAKLTEGVYYYNVVVNLPGGVTYQLIENEELEIT